MNNATEEEIRTWFRVNCKDSRGTVEFGINQRIEIHGNIVFLLHVTQLPYKIYSVTGYVDAEQARLETMENFPDIVGGDLYVSKFLTSFEGIPAHIKDQIHLPHFNYVIDPYEYRYLLFINVHKIIYIGMANIATRAIQEIITNYRGKPDQYHIAIEKLMEIGEKLGFDYD